MLEKELEQARALLETLLAEGAKEKLILDTMEVIRKLELARQSLANGQEGVEVELDAGFESAGEGQ